MPVNASEGPRLTDEERDEVLRVGVKTVAGAVPVVAGASGISVEHCIERARVAVECGADSIIAMPCNGMGGGQETIDLFGALAEATGLPVWLQNNKPPTGPTIPTPTIIRIMEEIPAARLLKEESLLPGNVMTAVLDACGDKVESIMGGMGGRYLLGEYRRGGAGTMPAGTHHRSPRSPVGRSRSRRSRRNRTAGREYRSPSLIQPPPSIPELRVLLRRHHLQTSVLAPRHHQNPRDTTTRFEAF